jgi:acetyl esterase/lipase
VVRVDPREVLTRTSAGPDAVVRYASHADGVIDVFCPPVSGAAGPLVVLLHGGFWRTEWDRVHARPMANALVAEGCTVAVPEYRRVGGTGKLAGGWPRTFDDVRAAITALPDLLDGAGLDPGGETVVAGHSAGGHLALWLAAQGFPLTRAVGLAPVADLRAAARDRLDDGADVELLGGLPEEVPDRYDAADPNILLSHRPGCDVVLVHGCEDRVVPVGHSRGLVARHPFMELHELPGIEHFGVIDPVSEAWPVVLSAVRGEQVAVG